MMNDPTQAHGREESLRIRVEELERKRPTWVCPTHQNAYGAAGAWTCPECEGAARHAESEHHAALRRHSWWKLHAGIPHRFRAADVSKIVGHSATAKQLAQAARAYVGKAAELLESGTGLVLLGPPGTGKTLTLTALVNELSARGYRAAYRSWPLVLGDLKAAFNAGPDDERRQAIEELYDLQFLALDELGVRAMSEFDHGELFRLLDYRYSEALPTLVASNSNAADWPHVVGERIADRLREVSPILTLAGTSQRGKHAVTGPDALPEPPRTRTVQIHSHGTWREREIGAPPHHHAGYRVL